MYVCMYVCIWFVYVCDETVGCDAFEGKYTNPIDFNRGYGSRSLTPFILRLNEEIFNLPDYYVAYRVVDMPGGVYIFFIYQKESNVNHSNSWSCRNFHTQFSGTQRPLRWCRTMWSSTRSQRWGAVYSYIHTYIHTYIYIYIYIYSYIHISSHS